MTFANSFDAALTDILLPLLSSYSRHCTAERDLLSCLQCCTDRKPSCKQCRRFQYLSAQISLPELAVCRPTSHGPQQVWVDLNDFLDSLRRYSTIAPVSDVCVAIQATRRNELAVDIEGKRRGRAKRTLTDIRPHAGSGIHCNDYSVLEDESKSCCPMIGFHIGHHVFFKPVNLHKPAKPEHRIDRIVTKTSLQMHMKTENKLQ